MKKIIFLLAITIAFLQGNFLFATPAIDAGDYPCLDQVECVPFNGQQNHQQMNIFTAINQMNYAAIEREINADRATEIVDARGRTPLYCAILKSVPIRFIEMIILRGTNINARCQRGNTALHVAVWKKRLDVVNMLLDYGADASIKNDKGSTHFILACLKGGIEIVELLFNTTDVDLNDRNNQGFTASDTADLSADENVVCFINKQTKLQTLKKIITD